MHHIGAHTFFYGETSVHQETREVYPNPLSVHDNKGYGVPSGNVMEHGKGNQQGISESQIRQSQFGRIEVYRDRRVCREERPCMHDHRG